MVSDPWWRDLVVALSGVLVGHALAQVAGGSAWRRELVHLAMQDLRRVEELTWSAGQAAADQLNSALGALASRLKLLGFREDQADAFFNQSVRLQGYMAWEVDPGEREEANRLFAWAETAPKGLPDDVRRRALEIDAELLRLTTLTGRLRVWRRRRRPPEPKKHR